MLAKKDPLVAQVQKIDDFSSYKQDAKLKFVQLVCDSIQKFPTEFSQKIFRGCGEKHWKADVGEFSRHP